MSGVAKHIPDKIIRQEVRLVLAGAVSTYYAYKIIESEDFLPWVKQEVEETSAWNDEGYYTEARLPVSTCQKWAMKGCGALRSLTCLPSRLTSTSTT